MTVNNGGNYTAIPGVTFGAPAAGGTAATGTALMGVRAVTVTSANGTYTNVATPTVTFAAPPCTINTTTCVRATGTATMSSNNQSNATRRVTGINITNAGRGYVLPLSTITVTFSIGPATAVVNSLNVQAVAVGTGGSGYASAPSVTFNPTGATAVAAVTTIPSGTLTITALGDKTVQNPNFSGPNATTAPYNTKTITRNYGFGSGGTVSLVDAAGVVHALGVGSWNPTTITTSTWPTDLPRCSASNNSYTGANAGALCGQLVITRTDNGKQSIDAITVTAGGSAPWVVTANSFATNTGGTVTPPAGKSVADYTANFGRMGFSPLQTAIDSASPGDLILVQPGTYRENLLMWKPVRLQGVGASAVTINADAHPAGKMDQWRRQVNCAFGLNLDGTPSINTNGTANPANYDPTGAYSCPAPMFNRVDRIPFEAIVGWDASGNGNLAQVLQEPTLMGAYEGAGITVLGRGVKIPGNSNDFWGVNATGGAGAFTDGSVYIGGTSTDCGTASTTSTTGRDYGTSNFYCNPSRIDGVSVINSSQGGGGVFIHGWGHNLEVANTRISGNHGTLAGAINLGNGETPDAFINDGVECGVTPAVMPCPPIPAGTANGAAIPFQFNQFVRIHHNMLYNNASIGDALFSGTPAGAGAITISAGSDNYRIDHNWMAGNLSTGDGGGLQQLGLVFNGHIDHNFVLYNQSTNPTLPTNGGGVVIEGANLDRQLNGTECGSTTDQDCPPGLTEGAGPGLVIDANLILGNSAESGSGAGLRIQQINGSADLLAFPTQQQPVVRRDRDQQHHRQQPGWLRWRRCVHPGCAESGHGQQHGGLERHDGLGRGVVQDAGRDLLGYDPPGLHAADRSDAAAERELHDCRCSTWSATCGPGRGGTHAEPGGWFGWRDHQLLGPERRLHR